MQEYKTAKHAKFITLTYDTQTVPITKNGYMEIKKRDLQLFFKRLRKNRVQHTIDSGQIFEQRIKYYAVGEYGGTTKRPHYHIILFNCPTELIMPAWNQGNIHYGDVNEASVGYTMKYIAKPKRIPAHRNDDRTPEFALISKGIGDNYIDQKQILKWHHADLKNRMYCNLLDGKKISMPRYYKDKIYNKIERQIVGHFTRIRMIDQETKKMLKEISDEIYWAKKAEWDTNSFKRMHEKESFIKSKL